MNETAFDKLIAALARGNDEWAQTYLSHFPREQRSAPAVRQGLAQRVTPEIMVALEEAHPWLFEDEPDDLPARILAALHSASADGLTASQLAQKLRRVPVSEISDAVDLMRRSNEIALERKPTGGRIANVYRLAEFVPDYQQSWNPFA